MRTSRGRRRPDDGATLIIVLIIVTVVSAVMSVVIAQADTSIRTTVALRDQASDNYAADGATNAILNALKTSGIDCDNPTPSPTPLGSVPTPFYSPASTQQGPINASALCTPDAIEGASTTVPVSQSPSTVQPPPVVSTAPYPGQGDPTLPTYAVLTTGNGPDDFGLDFTSSSPNTPIYIENGSVGSNKDIDATGDCMIVRLAGTGQYKSNCNQISDWGTGVSADGMSRLVVKAERNCVGGTFRPTACESNSSDVAAPAPPALPGPIVANNPAPLCKTTNSGQGNQTTYAVFYPGLYDTAASADGLSRPCGTSAGTVYEWLSPGAYYFNFPSGSVWSWPTRVIAGTPVTASGATISGLDKGNASTLDKLQAVAASPGACMDPDPNRNTAGQVPGVALVFGGTSSVAANTSTGSAAEVCASSTDTQANPNAMPPIAMYALTQAQTVQKSSGAGGGSVQIPAESIGTASLIDTQYSNSNGHAQIYIKGFVYAPTTEMVLRLENSSGQVFNWGVVVRDLRLTLNGASPLQPVFKLPKPNTGVGSVTTTTYPQPSQVMVDLTGSPETTYTIRYIDVWTCTVADMQKNGWPECPTSGTPNVQVKVRYADDGTAPVILSWNHIR